MSTGVGYHVLLQEIFPTQGSNPHLPCLPHCRWTLYSLSHLGEAEFQANRILGALPCPLYLTAGCLEETGKGDTELKA